MAKTLATLVRTYFEGGYRNNTIGETEFRTFDYNTFKVNAFTIGEMEFRSLLDNLRKDEAIRLVSDCKEGDHEDFDYFITFDYNTNKNRWDMVLTNNNGLRVVGENLIMKMLWREECKPFESYELPMRMAFHFGYLREQNSEDDE